MNQIQKLRCDKRAGRMRPVIDRNRCEGRADCVAICPYHVFEVGRLTAQERGTLSLVGRAKLFVHGGRQALVVRVDACRACGLCVRSCPEKAITLVAVEEVAEVI